MDSKKDFNQVIDILLQHYCNVGSNGYPASVYQDEHLDGITDGIDLVSQAYQLYQTDRQKFNQTYLQHRYDQSQTLSLTKTPMYYMIGYYKPQQKTTPIRVGLIVHVPNLKYSHYFELLDVSQLSGIETVINSIEQHTAMKTFYNFDRQLHAEIDSNNPNNRNLNINNSDYLSMLDLHNAFEYQFDKDNIMHTTTSEATLDLDVNRLIAKYRN